MKKSQRDTFTPTEDFEDLTLFANESFDTEDVDLFEFTSEDSSPLTRLKSIILSLDWEINDEILQELADEIDNLQPMWEGDKIAEVYLQGLTKIGKYIQTRGAYAHPNSIKLLLTFFYNFEKIISSPDITGDQITQLLKGDVRKFKILQYQITQSEQEGEVGDTEGIALVEVASTSAARAQPEVHLPDDAQPTQLLKAAILGLDWEVTDESLKQFDGILVACYDQLSENVHAKVLLQGLQALGDYIGEERAQSHPDAFTLLHSFSEALEQVTAIPALDDDVIQDLLVDRINRLNNLKMIIASPESDGTVSEEVIAGVVEEISSPSSISEAETAEDTIEEVAPISLTLEEGSPQVAVGAQDEGEFSLGDEIDSIFGMESKPAMETADEQYPDEILPPEAIHPVDDELADDLIGAQLSSKRGLAPALADADEIAGFSAGDESEDDISVQNDLTEQLDFLFTDATDALPAEPSHEEVLEAEPIAALADVDFSLDEADGSEAAGAETDVEVELEEGILDIENKLDSFFTDDFQEEDIAKTSDVKTEEVEDEELPFFEESLSPSVALADSEEQGGFSEEEAAASLDHSPLDEIEEKLDFFFGDELDEQIEPATAAADKDDDNVGLAPALSGFEEKADMEVETAPAAATIEDEDIELSGALDAYFGTSDEVAEHLEERVMEADTLTEAIEAGIDADLQVAADTDTFQVPLSTLGALLPAAVRELDREKLKEAHAILNGLQEQSPTSEHKALAQLLQSVVTMLSRLPAKSESDTEKLVNYLYEQLLVERQEPTVLVTAVGRFNSWMQEAGMLMPLVPAAGTEDEKNGPQYQYTAKELYFELAQLRLYMNEEFAKIRHHLEHHH